MPLSSVLGPADWTHGIARPFQNVVADPNPNLTVQLFRPAGRSDGSAFAPQARWRPAGGLGVGSGVLLDIHGEIGRVSMSVILVPFPQRPQSAEPGVEAGTGVQISAQTASTSRVPARVTWVELDSG